MKLSDFEVLSFDCYGTLIDWESGIHAALAPLRARARTGLSRDAVLEAFAGFESRQQALTPSMAYADLLAEVHGQLAAAWGVPRDTAEDARFGGSIGDWPAFPDTVEALGYLKRHFRLVILSNVDRTSFQATNQRLGVAFDAIHTAQDIGSYKPDSRNFAYLLDRVKEQGVAKARLLHVAQSLFHDHVPANAIGLASAWIDRRHDARGWGATAPVSADVRYDFRFVSLGALVEEHRAGG
jgi:2-haloalkanoic acid dehalogenase type II